MNALDKNSFSHARLNKYFKNLKRIKKIKRIKNFKYLIMSSLIYVLSVTPAYGSTDNDHLKLYAHSRIINWDQFQCLNNIIKKESRWSITAVNGSHYGLGQMRNVKYRTLDGYRQIDWTIRYITKRYGSMCNAWRFHQERNWY
jgi:hypothetical protein